MSKTVWQINRLTLSLHGGSGSSIEEIREAISYGAIKMNIEYRYAVGFFQELGDYLTENLDYPQSQIGNPDGDDKPNKKFYDSGFGLEK